MGDHAPDPHGAAGESRVPEMEESGSRAAVRPFRPLRTRPAMSFRSCEGRHVHAYSCAAVRGASIARERGCHEQHPARPHNAARRAIPAASPPGDSRPRRRMSDDARRRLGHQRSGAVGVPWRRPESGAHHSIASEGRSRVCRERAISKACRGFGVRAGPCPRCGTRRRSRDQPSLPPSQCATRQLWQSSRPPALIARAPRPIEAERAVGEERASRSAERRSSTCPARRRSDGDSPTMRSPKRAGRPGRKGCKAGSPAPTRSDLELHVTRGRLEARQATLLERTTGQEALTRRAAGDWASRMEPVTHESARNVHAPAGSRPAGSAARSGPSL